MYEKFYGLSAPPFQINPDPSFYFESKGHGSAYQYLRFGAFQGEGFIVVTGEIGAGKTTLLRALLAELDPTKIVAAQLVSTQLAADDLLSAVALAFGINIEGLSKAKQLVTLEAYLASLAASNRRALLIIDEAQNLSTAAIEELRMLSNFQFGNRALLQSFLVGQPELREILRLPRMEQLRQRVLASCHLGPMEPHETRAYIEHRLRHVGWAQRPAIEAAAFEAIHNVTGGVPRRINTLCNRLLLSAFLDEAEIIDAQRVHRAEADLSQEISGTMPVRQHRPLASNDGVLLCVAASESSLLAAGLLARACAQREDLPPMRVVGLVGPGAIDGLSAATEDLLRLGVHGVDAPLSLSAGSSALQASQVVAALASRFEAEPVAALVLAGESPLELACALTACAAALPVVRTAAGVRGGSTDNPAQRQRHLLDHAADLCFVADEKAAAQLLAEQVPARSLQLVGSLAVDAVRLALPYVTSPEAMLRREGIPPSLLSDPAGYALLRFDACANEDVLASVVALDANLREAGWRVSLLWAVPPDQRESLAVQCAQSLASSVRVVQDPAHIEWLGLLRYARCLLTDSTWSREQATTLGVPCLSLGSRVRRAHDVRQAAQDLADIIASGGRRPPVPPLWDGHTAERMAAALSDWLLARQDPNYEQFLAQGLDATLPGSMQSAAAADPTGPIQGIEHTFSALSLRAPSP